MELFCGEQAQDFPNHANYVSITGNNLAYFFTQTRIAARAVIEPWLDTRLLKKLLENIVANGTTTAARPVVILQVDADLFENQARFVEKYQNLRPESDQATRERILTKEAEIIRDFVNQGGIPDLAQKALAYAYEDGGDQSVTAFLDANFKLFGLRTEKPLRFGLWDVAASEDREVIVQQLYTPRTENTRRLTIAGMKKSVMAFAREGSEEGFDEATRLFEATDFIATLPTINLTNGYTPRTQPKFEAGQKPNPQSGGSAPLVH